MTITLTYMQIAELVFAVVIVIWLTSISRTTWRLEQFRKGLIAAAKAAPMPTDPKLIKGWIKLYNTLPKDKPKWLAYKNRLIEIGVLDKDGEKIKIDDGD